MGDYYRLHDKAKSAEISSELEKLGQLLNNYFDDETALLKRVPSVQYLADQLHVSPRYLGDMLRALTGQNTQQHIHNKLIEKAKEVLTFSDLTIGEIAYQLGFEHTQSFSKLFKSKTNYSPLEFRASFN